MQVETTLPVAVVTGAGRGIGRALVDVLLVDGFIVVPLVRNNDDIAELSALGEPGRVFPVCCDITENESEGTLAQFLAGVVSKVDLLFNNAGFGATGFGIEGLDLQELDRVLAVHCHGPIRCVRACLPFLKQSRHATIINVSSRFASLEAVATRKVPCEEATYAYRIAKAAMNMLTACLAVELESSEVKVLSVDPGKVKTRFGPADADVAALDAATAMIDLALSNKKTGQFLHASGRKLTW